MKQIRILFCLVLTIVESRTQSGTVGESGFELITQGSYIPHAFYNYQQYNDGRLEKHARNTNNTKNHDPPQEYDYLETYEKEAASKRGNPEDNKNIPKRLSHKLSVPDLSDIHNQPTVIDQQNDKEKIVHRPKPIVFNPKVDQLKLDQFQNGHPAISTSIITYPDGIQHYQRDLDGGQNNQLQFGFMGQDTAASNGYNSAHKNQYIERAIAHKIVTNNHQNDNAKQQYSVEQVDARAVNKPRYNPIKDSEKENRYKNLVSSMIMDIKMPPYYYDAMKQVDFKTENKPLNNKPEQPTTSKKTVRVNLRERNPLTTIKPPVNSPAGGLYHGESEDYSYSRLSPETKDDNKGKEAFSRYRAVTLLDEIVFTTEPLTDTTPADTNDMTIVIEDDLSNRSNLPPALLASLIGG